MSIDFDAIHDIEHLRLLAKNQQATLETLELVTESQALRLANYDAILGVTDEALKPFNPENPS